MAPEIFSSSILVVDDDEQIRKALSRILQLDGYQIFTACDGAAALEFLRTRPVDLAIIDYSMPGMTGVELAARLKMLYPEMVRILLTAEMSFEIAQEAINKAGVRRYLVKPWDDAKLRIEVLLAIDEKRTKGH